MATQIFTRDNYWFIALYATKEAAWGLMNYDGKAHYIALNRAARRCLKSTKFQTRAKAEKIIIDIEQMILL